MKKDTNSYQGIPIIDYEDNSQSTRYSYYVARIPWFSLELNSFPLIGNNQNEVLLICTNVNRDYVAMILTVTDDKSMQEGFDSQAPRSRNLF